MGKYERILWSNLIPICHNFGLVRSQADLIQLNPGKIEHSSFKVDKRVKHKESVVPLYGFPING
ncbi:hypothetical protein NC651_018344 [Populus alba x Populus x berolinensis]|nr:hypothetical protein NC651_018344 [Populus alba x Populus x berolinensis]